MSDNNKHRNLVLPKPQPRASSVGNGRRSNRKASGWCSLTNYDATNKSARNVSTPTAPDCVKGYIFKRRRFPFKGSHQVSARIMSE
ncbi:hypothetical protein Ciccas_012678 [Cichlidogyrus casuarinus]|uniref:Uncharacterized protein n=1 Tax=Cichlidogyrus casuarinus TaxID=1844966 RepID=A0ABD2PNE5_9PLAT